MVAMALAQPHRRPCNASHIPPVDEGPSLFACMHTAVPHASSRCGNLSRRAGCRCHGYLNDNGGVQRSDDFLLFMNRALDGMVRIVSELGDELANRRPDLPNANSPYQILTHCLGVVEFWVGHLIAGRENRRDRTSEFQASGQVADLVTRVEKVQRQLPDDLAGASPADPIEPMPQQAWVPRDRVFTQEMALIHVVEELCQHHGHMELTRDVLRALSG
jgi:hypothetical protein